VTSPTCAGMVRIDKKVRRCVTTAKVERDGLWFCGWHDPVAVAARQAPAGDRAAIARLQAVAPGLLETASALIARHDVAARASNFDTCGCGDCKAFRTFVSYAEGSHV
jgi:hypothetical protein